MTHTINANAWTDTEIRLTALQMAVNSLSSGIGQDCMPSEVIQMARSNYLFLASKDPIVDVTVNGSSPSGDVIDLFNYEKPLGDYDV